MVSHSRPREWRAAEWQQSNSVGDPADQSVYSADTFSRRCEGLDFSSDGIYCPLCPRLLSTVSQSGRTIINVLKLHTHTHWLETSSSNGGKEINLHRIFFIQAAKRGFEQKTQSKSEAPGNYDSGKNHRATASPRFTIRLFNIHQRWDHSWHLTTSVTNMAVWFSLLWLWLYLQLFK